jgi:pyruvate dehydrogenase E1 component alpha subunit
MNPHTTSDDSRRYRHDAELESWRQRDPIARLRRHLERETDVGAAFFADVEDEAQKLAVRVREGGRSLATVGAGAVFEHVFERPPADLVRQRDAFVDFVARGID